MKRIAIFLGFMSFVNLSFSQNTQQAADSFYLLSPVEVRALRVGERVPVANTNLSKKEIERLNTGVDIPFLLNQTPSVVANSDAGNGVGYTGLRIRGTDATRINVTLNGIPYNDAESQGTFFVDLPDFSSSAGSIQIIRGVGTSSNGSGAFGASINLSTNEVNREAYGEFNNSFGSFNTWKNTFRAGTGLLKDQFTADIRLSHISSNGYIDRATSKLHSYYFSTAWLAKKSTIRLNIFSGNEKTYQAWNGVSEFDLRNGNRTINYAGTEKPGEPYKNETDNFRQDHYQLFFDHKFNDRLSFNTAFFLTKGKGYYEQYKAEEDYGDYGLSNPSPAITSTDLVRQLWLQNDFYGNIFSLQLNRDRSRFVFGGGWTRYDGDHFGEIVWAQNGTPAPNHRWYDNDAIKTDLNLYFKQQTQISSGWNIFYDLQYRKVKYDVNGFRDNPSLEVSNDYDFFNPKAGITYNKNNWKAYASYGIANKEPNRDDFESGAEQMPRREQLHDIEWGIERKLQSAGWAANFYYMNYNDQLVLTGKINDVGAYTRTNIPKSYRLGVELSGYKTFNSWFNIAGNISLSKNKVKNFTEFLDDYDMGGQKSVSYSKTDLAFSPEMVASASLNFTPVKNFEVSLISKYVSNQYMDNTSNANRKLDDFYTQDLRIDYRFSPKWTKEISVFGKVNNLFNEMYEPNGYTFSYIYGGETITENFYFPMAGVNWMVGVGVKL